MEAVDEDEGEDGSTITEVEVVDGEDKVGGGVGGKEEEGVGEAEETTIIIISKILLIIFV